MGAELCEQKGGQERVVLKQVKRVKGKWWRLQKSTAKYFSNLYSLDSYAPGNSQLLWIRALYNLVLLFSFAVLTIKLRGSRTC